MEQEMKSWKEFGQNPVTHSAAHHLAAIASLIDAFGYARVTDVAEALSITRGSVSIMLKTLKQRGYVTQDSRGFLRLSDEGMKIVRGVQAKKSAMMKLFTDVLGVDPEQANIDTCKIEHLISSRTTERVTRFLRFIESGSREAQAFLKALRAAEDSCDHDTEECPLCEDICLADEAAEMPEKTKKGRR